MVERVERQGKTFALIVRSSFDKEGVSFVTDDESPLQLGVLKHPRGFTIKPHVHKPASKTVTSIQEVLHVQYGKVRVGFHDDEGVQVASAVLAGGDTVLLISGGHGFEMLEDCKMIEVKQGPYEGVEHDKKRLEVGGG